MQFVQEWWENGLIITDLPFYPFTYFLRNPLYCLGLCHFLLFFLLATFLVFSWSLYFFVIYPWNFPKVGNVSPQGFHPSLRRRTVAYHDWIMTKIERVNTPSFLSIRTDFQRTSDVRLLSWELVRPWNSRWEHPTENKSNHGNKRHYD